MPASPVTETVSGFAWEGFLPLWITILIGVLLMGLAVWLSRRDARAADKPRLVPVLFLCRALAILILLWMLAGPTRVNTTRSSHSKTIAVLVDASASMGLVDPIDGSGNTTRWTSRLESNQDIAALRKLDAALATLREAQHQATDFSEIRTADGKSGRAAKLLSHAVSGIEQGSRQLNQVLAELPSANSELKAGLGRAQDVIATKVMPPLRQKAGLLRSGKSLDALAREEWLPDCLTLLAGALDKVETLAESHVQTTESHPGALLEPVLTRASALSRLDKVRDWLENAESSWLHPISEKAEVLRFEFGEKLVPVGAGQWKSGRESAAETLAPNTNLDGPLRQVAADDMTKNVAAAILITDGGHNLGRDPRETAASLHGVPLHIVPIGNTKMQRDVMLHHTHAPKAVFLHDMVVVDSLVTAYDCAQTTLRVELMGGDKVLDSQTITVNSDVFDGRLQLRWKAEDLGRRELTLRVEPVANERTVDNNTSKLTVLVMEDVIRLLVADNFPRWEFRYLANLFKRDDRLQYEQLLFQPNFDVAGRGTAAPAFPRTLESWSRFRVVILGDLPPAQISREDQELMKKFVTELGGNLIIIAGDDAMPAAFTGQPLQELLPVERLSVAPSPLQPHYLYVTAEGGSTVATQIGSDVAASERLWWEMSRRLPLYNVSQFAKPKATAHVLITADTNPNSPDTAHQRAFLSWHYVGRGRVIYLAAPVSYQLRYRQGDAYHHRFWGQLIRWAIARDLAEGSRTVRLSTDKSRYEQGDEVQAVVRLSELDGRAVTGAACRLTALQADKVVQEILLQEEPNRPGNYRGVLDNLPPGPVKLRASGDRIKSLLFAEGYARTIEATVEIDPSGSLELRHPLCNLPLLRQLSLASGGIILPPTGLQAALEQLDLSPEISETTERRPLWNRWDLFWIFILCLSLEWIGRKLAGLA